MMGVIKKAGLILLLLAFPLSVFAAPVSWTFNGAAFNDGGTIVGSFIYDSDTNTYSGLDFVSTAGSSFAGTSYNNSTIIAAGATVLAIADSSAADLTGATGMSLFFGGLLSDLGGSRDLLVAAGLINGSRETSCTSASCQNFNGLRTVISGSVTGMPVTASAVPAPPALLLFLTGLIGLGFNRFLSRET